MNILDALFGMVAGPAKKELKESLLDGMDRCSRVLIVTRRIGEITGIFDSDTYTNLLNEYAEKHSLATMGMSLEELLEYMGEGAMKAKED